ncbi:MAG: deoxyguanosinetriphosphate triphosphohydrolase, partial [Pedobacter sp.]
MANPSQMSGTPCPAPGGKWDELPAEALARCVCDYVAGMTDRYASQTFADLFLPSSWRGA